MEGDYTECCKQCASCNRANVPKQEIAAVVKIPVPDFAFLNKLVDHVVLLSVSVGDFSYMLTMVDRTTRWPEALYS